MTQKEFRLVVLCVATVIVFLALYFIAESSQWMYIAATAGIKMTGGPYYKPSLTGYVLALRYGGQQAAGVRALASLQRWVKNSRMPMLIVEPFINNSVLGMYGDYSQQSVKFSDMFDMESFNRVSRREGVTELVRWETYVTRAPPDAILVRIKTFQDTDPKLPLSVQWTAQAGSRECWQSEGGYSDNDVWLNNKHLCYIRVIDISFKRFSSQRFSAKEVHTVILAGQNPTDVTIVFEEWRAPWRPRSPLFSSASDSSNSVHNTSVFFTQRLHDSPKLLRDMKNYQKQFLKKKSSRPFYVAVMLRSEHCLLMLNKVEEGNINHTIIHAYLQNCLDEVVNKTNVVMAQLGAKSVFVTADVGLYGSNTWPKTASRTHLNTRQLTRVETQVKRTVERLYNDQWMFEQWEKSFPQATGGVEDRGYIAALQRGIASQGSCLILLGGGEFHTLTLKEYVDRTQPHTRCIKFVCIHEYAATPVLYALKDA